MSSSIPSASLSSRSPSSSFTNPVATPANFNSTETPAYLSLWQQLFPTASVEELKKLNDQFLQNISNQIRKDTIKNQKRQAAIKKMLITGEYDPPIF
ncbi:MAG: hypothetical protein ACOVOR_01825 [Rhabdochlamydiaceae bacterium]